MEKTLSIVFPTLNEEGFIEDSLRLIRNGLKSIPFELIVSDGGSKDRTVEIAQKYADKVVCHTGEERQNISQGRNAGAEAGTGKFVVFMDADSRVYEPEKFFHKAIEKFEKDSELLGLTVRLKVHRGEETFSDKLVWPLLNLNLRFLNNVLHRGESTGEFQMIRMEAFRRLKGFREDLVTREDADMFLRLSEIGRTKWAGDLTVYHSGRRAHKIGWFKLLSTWMLNVVWVLLFNRAYEKEWKVIR